MSDKDEIIEDFSGMTKVNGVVVQSSEETGESEHPKSTRNSERTDETPSQRISDGQGFQENTAQANDAYISPPPMRQGNDIHRQSDIPKTGLFSQIKRIGIINVVILAAILIAMTFFAWKYWIS